MSDDHGSSASACPITRTPQVTTHTAKQIWCAIRAGCTLSCQMRMLRDGSGWDVLMKTGVDTLRPHWLVQWLQGDGRRLIDCQRESRKLLLIRRCADEATARFVTEMLRQDSVRAGWRIC